MGAVELDSYNTEDPQTGFRKEKEDTQTQQVKNPPANAGDAGDAASIPGLGRSPGGGHGNPLQCSCLETPMDRGAWRAAVYGATKESDTTEGCQGMAQCS